MTMLITEAVPILSNDLDSTRLEVSPYAAPSVALQLKDASRLYVPAHLLWGVPELPASGEDGVYHLDIPHDVAHILVHYLFTNTYQCLKPKGSSLSEKLIAEFSTSIRVYTAARKYKLPVLEELTRAEIIRLGSGFGIPLVFDLIQEAYPNPNSDDTWLCQYLKSRLKILFTDPRELLEWDPTVQQKATTISDILLKNMLELLQENMSLTHRPINGIHETSQATLLKADSIPTESIEPLKSAEPDAIEINTDQNPVSNDIEMKMNDNNTGKNGIDTYKDHVNTYNDAINTAKKGIDSDKNTNLDKNDVNLSNNEDNMRKSDSNTSKSDDEITRNGAHTPVSKSGSCEPETPKGDHVINGLDNGAKATEDKKDEKDFWGLSLKKKKKKKTVKGLTAESLQEGVAVKP